MNSLLYLSYGSGPHEQEVIFSILSAIHWSSARPDHQTLVYTDHPERFEELPVQVVYISPELWDDWAGPKKFNHRRKILALMHALQHNEGKVVLLDGDTWLRAPAARLFDRVSPGHTLMHIREGRVSEIDTSLFNKMHEVLERAELHDATGHSFRIPTDAMMYNAGVIGLDPADAGLLDAALELTDQLCEKSQLHVLEQFAFSHVLAKRTSLQEADDLVFHYWPAYLHEPFRRILPELMAQAEPMPMPQRADFLFAHRPKPTWPRRGKVVVKRALQFAGIIRGRCRTNEW